MAIATLSLRNVYETPGDVSQPHRLSERSHKDADSARMLCYRALDRRLRESRCSASPFHRLPGNETARLSATSINRSLLVLKLAFITLLLVGGLVGLLIAEAMLARRGPEVPYRPPSPEPRTLGSGPSLAYVVLGDSTAAGQGAPYDHGIALATARHLASANRVTLTNLAVSGARMRDVELRQVPAAVRRRPDIVLIAAGANDVTGLTPARTVTRSLDAAVRRLRSTNPEVDIVVTAAPDMGSIPRLAQPLRIVAGWRTRQLNAAIEDLASRRDLVLAPIARKTGPAFRRDANLFAVDRFHPNARGYATWIPVLTEALDAARRDDAPSHATARPDR